MSHLGQEEEYKRDTWLVLPIIYWNISVLSSGQKQHGKTTDSPKRPAPPAKKQPTKKKKDWTLLDSRHRPEQDPLPHLLSPSLWGQPWCPNPTWINKSTPIITAYDIVHLFTHHYPRVSSWKTTSNSRVLKSLWTDSNVKVSTDNSERPCYHVIWETVDSSKKFVIYSSTKKKMPAVSCLNG